MAQKKQEIITFKVSEDLASALAGVHNRSDFIRQAVLAALGNACPLCSGTGALSVSQMKHWEEFTAGHHMETCGDCDEAILVCSHEETTRSA